MTPAVTVAVDAHELEAKVAELTAEQEEELQLLQAVLDARVDHLRYRESLARFLQFRAEQQEAA